MSFDASARMRGPVSRGRAARPFNHGRRASTASLRIGESPRPGARRTQGPLAQTLNCPPKRGRSTEWRLAILDEENPENNRRPGSTTTGFDWSASGLAAVWAEANTREAIYAALRRKETFATSGPRIRVQFFAGYDLDAADARRLYATGVPMGGDLEARPSGSGAPRFFAWALRDPSSAWLQRLQIVKGWLDDGAPQERVYDVACSDGLEPSPDSHRCPDNGASVNLETCDFDFDKGDVELKATWEDPDFDPDERAFYYVRALENPTCRWSTWDANRLGLPLRLEKEPTLQERAWTSPIWILPQAAM